MGMVGVINDDNTFSKPYIMPQVGVESGQCSHCGQVTIILKLPKLGSENICCIYDCFAWLEPPLSNILIFDPHNIL